LRCGANAPADLTDRQPLDPRPFGLISAHSPGAQRPPRGRRRTRSGNSYGQDPAELSQILVDLVEIEPLLRRSADLVLLSTEPTAQIADALLERIAEVRRTTA
jgi:hypothetical protein